MATVDFHRWNTEKSMSDEMLLFSPRKYNVGMTFDCIADDFSTYVTSMNNEKVIKKLHRTFYRISNMTCSNIYDRVYEIIFRNDKVAKLTFRVIESKLKGMGDSVEVKIEELSVNELPYIRKTGSEDQN